MIGEGLVRASQVCGLAWSEADTGCILTKVKDQGRERRVKLTEHRSLNQAVLYVPVSIVSE